MWPLQVDLPLLPEAAPPLLAPPPEPPQEALLAAPVPVDGLQQQQLYQQHHQAMQLEAFGGAGADNLSPGDSQSLLLDAMSTGAPPHPRGEASDRGHTNSTFT